MKSAALLLIGALVWSAALTSAQDIHGYRLPTHILPSNYKLQLTPYLAPSTAEHKQFTFDAIAEIILRTTQTEVRQIVLHSKELEIATVRLTATDGLQPAEITINSRSQNTTTDKLVLELATALRPNVDYLLRFVYVGPLNSDMYGFYASSYSEGGQTKWAATTQMQATHARRVFPSFDEPAFKATFDVTINRPANFQPSISNTRLSTSQTLTNGLVQEVFGTTPRMSTYLLAFIVSEFTVREDAAKTFGVIARPDAYNQTEYAFRVGPLLLEEMNKWTEYNYTSVPGISKMHMAALPDFSAGAMENWGLLTYRETALLYSVEESTSLAQQRVASVITHEQAHMWFGDLVTCEWWDNTWLNEGFARFFQYFGTELVEKDWSLDLQFVVEQVQTALGYDSVESARSLTSDVWSPAEVSSAFDSISYNKGASVIRMIQHLMGKERFQTAIRDYIKENQFGTTTPVKLYAALQKQSGVGVISNVFNPWTNQAGYPLVHVQRNGPTNVTISQERFFLKQRVANEQRWPVPLSYASARQPELFNSTASQLTLTEKSETVAVADLGDWGIFNVQQTGYYRVNYDTATWANISAALKTANHANIDVLNRAQIVDDVLNLARAEYVNYTLALDAVQYLEKEVHYIPWLAAFNNLNFVARRLSGDDLAEYKKFIINLSKYAYEALTFNGKAGDSRLEIYNRLNILNYRCKFGESDCVNAANAQFNLLQTNAQHKVPVNVRSVVYCTAIAQGNQTVWDQFWRRFQTANVAAEQVLILSALGCTRSNATLIGYIERIISDDVRLQDKASAFAATYNEQAENVQTVLDYVILNHQSIATAFKSTNNVVSILSNLAARFTSRAQIEQLRAFRTATAPYSTSTGLQTAIADAEFNLLWSDKHLPTITKYIREKNGAGALTSALLMVVLGAILAIFH